MDNFLLGDCLVRPAEHVIERKGESVRVEPRTMALLVYLASRAGEVVTRGDIEEQLWGGRVVGYEALTQTVAKLRRALGEDTQAPRYLLTVPKAGYQLIVEVSAAAREDPAPAPSSVDRAKPGDDAPGTAAVRARPRRRALAGAAILAVAAMIGAAWWPRGTEPARRIETSAARGPSLAVLPFANHNEGNAADYMADGLTEDLITALTHFPELFVIALNSSFAYKGKPLDPAQVRRDLGVRYVVVGSVQSGGGAIRVQAQLVDTEAGTHIWAEKYDQPRGDLFAIQDQLVDAISSRILPHVQEAEKRRARHKPTESLDAYDLFQRARSEKHKLTAESEARAVALLRQAIALDPNFAEAHMLLGWVSALQRLFGGSGPSYEESLASVQRGLELNPGLSIGYQALAQVLTFMNHHEEAAKAGLKAIEINPNDAENHIMFSRAASTAGWYKQAVASAERAVALNPLYPKWYPYMYSRALYADSQYERAAEVCIDGMARQAFVGTAIACVAALEQLGRHDEAVAMTVTARTMAPQLTLQQAMSSWGFREERLNRQFEQALRAGGLGS